MTELRDPTIQDLRDELRETVIELAAHGYSPASVRRFVNDALKGRRSVTRRPVDMLRLSDADDFRADLQEIVAELAGRGVTSIRRSTQAALRDTRAIESRRVEPGSRDLPDSRERAENAPRTGVQAPKVAGAR